MENKLEKIYNEYFKDSKITISKACLGNGVFIKLYLAKNEHEEINGYFDNDMLKIMFYLKKIDNDSYILENIVNFYHIKPTNEYMVYSTKKVGFRKTQGNEDKILKAFKKYVEKLHDAIVDDLENNRIHENHIELVKNKIKK